MGSKGPHFLVEFLILAGVGAEFSKTKYILPEINTESLEIKK